MKLNHKAESLEYFPMTIDHYRDVIKLWEKTEGLGLTTGDTEDSIKKYLDHNPGMSFVCTDKESGTIIGTVLGGHDGRRGFIYHLAVDNDHRNNSIGKNLVDHSVSEIRTAGIERCIIMVKTGNEKGESFWKKLGWNKRDDLMMYSNNLKI